jgi:nitroimidazol reductase NimA-like FMN-containing flavoprotein (pyridoxamine 5'-phosphate oxidase superfamily)
MPIDELKKEIRAFLNNRKALVLCTCLNNIPRATPMDFYMEKSQNNFDIYVGLTPGRKVKNIEENPIVSIGIYTPMDTGKIQGLQITATGKLRLRLLRENDEEFDSAQKIVRGKRNLILKIIPEKIEMLDYDFVKRGYSRFQVLEL